MLTRTTMPASRIRFTGSMFQSAVTTLALVVAWQTYVWRSMYVDHLQKWLRVFPPESVCGSNPAQMLYLNGAVRVYSSQRSCRILGKYRLRRRSASLPIALLSMTCQHLSCRPGVRHSSHVFATCGRSMLVVPSESLKEAGSFKTVMERFATLLSLPRSGSEVCATV